MDRLPMTLDTETTPYIRPHRTVKKRKKSPFLLFFLLFCGVAVILFCAFGLPEGAFDALLGYFSTLQTTENTDAPTETTIEGIPSETTTAPAPVETTDIYFWDATLPVGATPILPRDLSAGAQGLFAENPVDAPLGSVIPSFPEANEGEVSVLILSSHDYESYADAGMMYYTDAGFASNREEAHRVTAVAKALCASLEEHNIDAAYIDTMQASAFGAYSNGKKLAELAMREHKKAVLVIDIHRGVLSDDKGALLRPIRELAGETIAQTRILLGTKVNFDENAPVALSLYEQMNLEYPHLCMPLAVTKSAYLQGLSLPVLTLEVGTAGNAVSEAMRAAELLGAVISEMLG